jgi:hypothetical protein
MSDEPGLPNRETDPRLSLPFRRLQLALVRSGYAFDGDTLFEAAKVAAQVVEANPRAAGGLSEHEALVALNRLRSNIVGTQNASWSNVAYPLVAILDAAGFELEPADERQMAEHLDCYGGAGGYPGGLKDEPSPNAAMQARNLAEKNRRREVRMQELRDASDE